MRTLVAFAIVASALFVVGVAAAAILEPKRDLFLPPPARAYCEDAYFLRAKGTLTWLTLEGGMWAFRTGGESYDLEGVGRLLSAERIAWLQGHEGTGVPAGVEGVAEPCLATFHMNGVVVRLTVLDA